MSRTWHKKREQKKRGAKAWSSHCANNGGCSYCEGNRTHKHKKGMLEDEEAIGVSPELPKC